MTQAASTPSEARNHAVEQWDTYIRGWLSKPLPPTLPPPLARWFAGYGGSVTSEAMPEPYVGRWEAPRIVTLGLHPGAADLEMQGRNGVFAKEVTGVGSYSAWASTDPYGQSAWEHRHGVNAFRARQLKFARRWTEDEDLSGADVLNVSLYPWHFASATEQIQPPLDVLDEFVWAPLAETGVPLIFAFGAAWADTCERLGLTAEDRWGPGGNDFGSTVKSRTIVTYRPSADQRIVVCWQQGYAGPPGAEDVARMRAAIGAGDDLHRGGAATGST